MTTATQKFTLTEYFNYQAEKVTLLTLVDGLYEEEIFVDDQLIISPSFGDQLSLTPRQIIKQI